MFAVVSDLVENLYTLLCVLYIWVPSQLNASSRYTPPFKSCIASIDKSLLGLKYFSTIPSYSVPLKSI